MATQRYVLTSLVVVWLLSQQSAMTEANPCSSGGAFIASTEAQAVQVQQAAALSVGLTRTDLPVRRPSQPWPYRDVSTATLSTPATDSAGVTYAEVHHKALAGVTPAMMMWWFNQNLEKVTKYAGDGKNYTLYLQWHPRDHCHQVTTNRAPGPGATGDTWKLQEFLMASQNFTRSHSTGFDATSEAQINVNLHVTSLNRTGLTIQYQLTTSGLPLTSLSHTWKRTSAGLDLVSQYQIGNVGLGASFNQLVNCQVSRGDDPLVVAGKWQHHTVEEFGNLERILPALYRQRNNL